MRILIVAALALASCAAPPEAPPREEGIPLKDYARKHSGRHALQAGDLVPALQEVARTHKDSPELLLRAAYFLLALWPEDADWDTVRSALIRAGASEGRQWAYGSSQERSYRIEFVAAPAAWVSPGGHRYDLMVSADLKFDVAGGRRTRTRVQEPEAFLRAHLQQDRLKAAKEGGYPSDSGFRKIIDKGTDRHRFLTTISARYRWRWDRWSDVSSFGFEFDAEFVDHPGGQFETARQSFGAVSLLDPPMDHARRLYPQQAPPGHLWDFLGRGSGGSSSIGDGHAFVRVDEAVRSDAGC